MKVLFEDEVMVVVNKPAGMVVNRAENVKTETVQDWVESQVWWRAEGDEVFVKRSGVAHRIDKETSGCLIVAKSGEALGELMAQFKQRTVEKWYWALVHGRVQPDKGVVRLPIKRDRFKREKRAVSYEGKKAETAWRVLAEKEYGGKRYSLVELRPKTGRTHQIRVHMSHLGYPLLGDKYYLNKKRLKEDESLLDRHFLHAKEIAFDHPVSGKRVRVKSELPEELEKVLYEMGFSVVD